MSAAELESPKDGAAGFHDVVVIEFCDARHELFGFLRLARSPAEGRTSVVALMFADGEPVIELSEPGFGRTFASWEQAQSGPAEMTIEQPLERWTAKLEHGDCGFEVELRALTAPLELAGDGPVGETTGTREYEQLCDVVGKARVRAESRDVRCTGRRVHIWGAPDWSAVEARRSIHMITAEGAGLAILAGRPTGAPGHDADAIGGRFVTSDTEPLPAQGVLVSTVYDDQRLASSAAVEMLVPGEELSHRATGEAICKAVIESDGGEHRVSFFRWSLDGRPGWGTYEVVSQSTE